MEEPLISPRSHFSLVSEEIRIAEQLEDSPLHDDRGANVISEKEKTKVTLVNPQVKF